VIKPSFKAATLSASIPSGIAPRFDVPASSKTESAADRIMLTLLALGLMLLAFFVVLTASATYDKTRTRNVVQSMQAIFVPAKDDAGKGEGGATDVDLQAAVSALRVAVSDVFSGILPREAPGNRRADSDRVEIDVPMSVFFANNEAVLFPLPVLDKLVGVLNAPPAGYRMELVVRAAGETQDVALDQARIAALAEGLVRHGLAPTALSVGTLQNAPNTDKAASARSLRFTFLLLSDDDDLAAIRMMTGKAAP
jgi:hypothetical protein